MKQTSEITERVETNIDLTNTPVETEKKGKAEKKSGNRIGYNYIILKSLKESPKNDVVKCLYIKSLINFGICVIKEGTYGETKDKQGRDIKDRLIWQKELHERLYGKVRLPKYMGSFEENGNYYLILERIKGEPLYKILRKNRKDLKEALETGNKLGQSLLNYMLQIISLLETLHNEQVVHRDVTAANFIVTRAGKVAIIDMELSYSLKNQYPDPPFKLGTYGYMSPQQEVTEIPTIQEDIFSLGAILLLLWTGISPDKMTNSTTETLRERVSFFVSDKEFAETIQQCLDADPAKRPALAEIRRMIEDYRRDLKLKRKRAATEPVISTKEEILETIQRSIGTLSSPLLAHKKRGWFSEDFQNPAHEEKNKINKTWFTSFSRGATGIIYMLSQAHKTGFDTSAALPHIEKALNLVEKKYISQIDTVSPSLYFGSAGIAASLATAIREHLFEPQTIHFDWIHQLIGIENTIPGFIDGMAGQGMAHWHCCPFLHEEKMRKSLTGYVNQLLATQEKNGSWIIEKSETRKSPTKGFARGAAGIIYFLLEYAIQYQEREPLKSAQLGLEWLMKQAINKNGAIQWKSSGKHDIGYWWCEGSSGIALAFLKAYKLLGDQRYRKYAIGALMNNPPNLIDNNFGQLDGLSGLGEVYLDAYQVLQEKEWLDRAGWIAEIIMKLKKEHKEYGPYWLVAHERQPTAEFMQGNSGIIHFLLRYCHPGQINFPLLGL